MGNSTITGLIVFLMRRDEGYIVECKREKIDEFLVGKTEPPYFFWFLSSSYNLR